MTRPQKESPRPLPGRDSPEQRLRRAKDRAAQMDDPGNNAINPYSAKWGWIAAGVIIAARLGVAIYDSIAGTPT